METPFDLLQHLASMLEELELPYAVGGSVAAMVYGEPRSTRDVDVVVSLREEDVPRLKEKFPSPEYYFDTETAREAIREGGQFNIIHDASGIKIDVYIPSDPIAHQQIVRARRMPADDRYYANFSSPEELILKKMEYYAWGGSEKHLRDSAEMIRLSKAWIDQERVERLAEEAGLGHVWLAVLSRLDK